MAKGRYAVAGGKIEASYDNTTVVLVCMNIPKSEKVASITPAP